MLKQSLFSNKHVGETTLQLAHMVHQTYSHVFLKVTLCCASDSMMSCFCLCPIQEELYGNAGFDVHDEGVDDGSRWKSLAPFKLPNAIPITRTAQVHSSASFPTE